MGKQVGWLLGLMLCGVWEFAAGTPEMPQGRQQAFVVARNATELQDKGRIPRNHHYQYRIAFRDGGIVVSPLSADPGQSSGWTWGLRLAGYGTPDHVQAVADAQIEMSGTRLEYRRGTITEWYENKPAGLEQGFTLHEPPAPEAADVVLVLAIGGGLHGKWERSGKSVGFLTESGVPALSYGDLRATDADGRRVPARLALGRERLEIHVQARGAKWPVVVDPLIAEPGEPIVDWIETDQVLGDGEGVVEIPVSWSRFYGEPALTAQYWLNDKLVLTRAVDGADEQSGGATLVIGKGGEYEVTVALCDTEGCSASDPLHITVIDPEQPLRTDAAVEEDVLSYEQAAQIVEQTAARLAADPDRPPKVTAARAKGAALWLASFVGQAALKYGLSLGFDALVKEIGLSSGGPNLAAELAAIDQSLGELRTRLDEISRKIDVGKADSDFKNSHRLADVAMQNIKTIAGNIAAAEAGNFQPTQFQLESWAKDNRDSIAALRSLLVNSLTGAVPLLLDYYQLKYPVSSGIEVRSEVGGYLDGFRAGLGVGLVNQAWLTHAFAPNSLYDDGASSDARATLAAAYSMSGAPYPQPPSGPSGFVHRLGSDWAMVSDDRPQIDARQPTKSNDSVEIYNNYGAIGAGVNAPGDISIEDYMVQENVKNGYKGWVGVQSSGSLTSCKSYVRYSEVRIGGNNRQFPQHTWWTSNSYWCPFPPGERFGKEDELKNQFSQTQWATKLTVTTNNWGMPALMDERSIEGYRDGIDVEAINREGGNAVTLIYDTRGYDWIQLRDPATDIVFFTGANQGRTLNLTTTSDAVEIVQGYRVENREGDDSLLPRERTIVTANPGSTSIDLTLDPR